MIVGQEIKYIKIVKNQLTAFYSKVKEVDADNNITLLENGMKLHLIPSKDSCIWDIYHNIQADYNILIEKIC